MNYLVTKLERRLASFGETLEPRYPAKWLLIRGVGKATLKELQKAGLVLPPPPEQPKLGPPPGVFEYQLRIQRLKKCISKHQKFIKKWKKELAEMRAWTVNSR